MIPNIYRYAAMGAAALALIALIIGGVVRCKKIDQQHDNIMIDAGTSTERAQQTGETINAIQNAQQVVRHPTDEQLNVVCNTYDRNCPHRP